MSEGKAPRVGILLLILTTAVLASVLIAPFTLPENSVNDLSGGLGVIDNGEVLAVMNPFARAVYTAADILSDQLSSNSYYLNGNQVPFPSRMVGLLFGLTWGALAAVVIRPRTQSKVLLGVVPILVDWSLQFTAEYTSTNTIRLITGAVAGIAIAMFLAAAFTPQLEDKLPPKPVKDGD
ncbi:DUF2085 domain-containing protein [Methanomassiliicoccus luminyensis]|uniref:DUF2085 domain-containing protein n=1 Tax=Methanomassiliicoccus luminyensis TaxID=1080712 RepID=UPI0004748541|nr:DUF2085 domain-containing protein [Methanomassiliicoccus luminyensis]